MSAVIGIIIRLLGLFGVSLSPFWAGAIAAGLAASAIGGAGLHLYNSGYRAADVRCEAASLRLQKAQLESRLAAREKQLKLVSAMQERDADRASEFEQKTIKLQEQIDATPKNPDSCLPRAGARRVREVK